MLRIEKEAIIVWDINKNQLNTIKTIPIINND